MEYTKTEIQAMLKLIPNGITVCLEDLKEMYSQEEKVRESDKSSHNG